MGTEFFRLFEEYLMLIVDSTLESDHYSHPVIPKKIEVDDI